MLDGKIVRTSYAALVAIFVAAGLLLGQSPEKKSDGGKRAGNVSEGQEIFEKRCAVCHLASSDKKKIGPGLKGLSKRKTFAEGKPINDQTLQAWIEDGGKNMPSFKGIITTEQIRDLIAYLKTL